MNKLVFKKVEILDEEGNPTGEFERVSESIPLSDEEISEMELHNVLKKKTAKDYVLEAGYSSAEEMLIDILENGIDSVKSKITTVKGK